MVSTNEPLRTSIRKVMTVHMDLAPNVSLVLKNANMAKEEASENMF